MLDLNSSNVPPLTINVTSVSPPLCEVVGWEEFDHWANLHNSTWHKITAVTRYRGMSDMDFLKILAGELLRQNVALVEQMVDLAYHNPPRMILITPNEDA